MASKVSTISRAYNLLGKKSIQIIDPQVDIDITAEKIYEVVVGDLLCRHAWRFALEVQQLSRLEEKPPIDTWSYQYLLPVFPTLYKVNRIFPNSNYAIYGDKLYSNQTTLQMEYVYRPQEDKFREHFVTAIIFELAAKIAFLITQKPQMASWAQAEAIKQTSAAMARDASEMPNPTIQNDVLYTAHFS